MANWDDFPVVPASPSRGWDAFPEVGTPKPAPSSAPTPTIAPSTFQRIAPALGAVTGGPLLHAANLAKPLLPKEWSDYITGVQRAAFQGATLNFGDEALAGLGSATGQGTYADLLDRERKSSKEFAQENPVGATAGELAGAVTGAVALPMGALGRTTVQAAAKGAPLLEKAGRMGARVLERALKGAGVGAGFGYGAGFGEGEGDVDARHGAATEGAKMGALFGSALNVGLPAVAAGAGHLIDGTKSAARGVAGLIGGPSKATNTDAAGRIIENLSGGSATTPRSAKDLLADLATGQSTAPQVSGVPIPSANIMGDANLQAATRAALRKSSDDAAQLQADRVTGTRNVLDPMRPEGAPIAARVELEAQDAARRAALDAAEAERLAAVREAQDAAAAQRFQSREDVRTINDDVRATGRLAADDVRDAGALRIQELGSTLDDQIAALQARGMSEVEAAHVAATDALMATGQFPNKEAASIAAREAIEAELAANKRIGKQLYREVPEGTRLNVEPVYDALAKVHREAYDSGRTSLIPGRVSSTEILDLFRNATPQRLQGMKSMLYEDAGELARAGKGTSAKWARDVAKSIDDVMAGAGNVEGSGVPQLQRAVQHWRERVVPYRQGAVGDILKIGADGLPRVEPSTALSKVIKPSRSGGTEAMDEFIQAAGGRENALTAATQWAIADAAEFAIGRNGRVDLPRLDKWMRERAPVLNALPGLRDRLGNARQLATRAEELTTRNAGVVERAETEAAEALRHAKEVVDAQIQAARGQGADAIQEATVRGREMLSQVEQRAKESVRAARDSQGANVENARRSVDDIQRSAAKFYLGADPRVAAEGIMNSPDPVVAYRRVARLLQGKPEAQAGLKGSIFDKIEAEFLDPTRGFSVVETPVRAQSRDLFARNDALLREVFGPEDAAKAVELLRALEMSKAHANVPGNVGSATAAHLDQGALSQEALTDVLIEKIGGRLVSALLNNRRTANNEAVRLMVREALLNPDEMRRVLEARVTRENAPMLAKRMADWMERRTMEGIPIRSASDARDKERQRRNGRKHGGAANAMTGPIAATARRYAPKQAGRM